MTAQAGKHLQRMPIQRGSLIDSCRPGSLARSTQPVSSSFIERDEKSWHPCTSAASAAIAMLCCQTSAGRYPVTQRSQLQDIPETFLQPPPGCAAKHGQAGTLSHHAGNCCYIPEFLQRLQPVPGCAAAAPTVVRADHAACEQCLHLRCAPAAVLSARVLQAASNCAVRLRRVTQGSALQRQTISTFSKCGTGAPTTS